MFTKFGRGRLSSDASLCGVRGWKNFAISVTVQDSPIIAANDY